MMIESLPKRKNRKAPRTLLLPPLRTKVTLPHHHVLPFCHLLLPTNAKNKKAAANPISEGADLVKQKLSALDSELRITEKATHFGHQISQGMQELDQNYQISEKATEASMAVGEKLNELGTAISHSINEAIETPQGKAIVDSLNSFAETVTSFSSSLFSGLVSGISGQNQSASKQPAIPSRESKPQSEADSEETKKQERPASPKTVEEAASESPEPLSESLPKPVFSVDNEGEDDVL